jgi:hypothetical protein
MKLGAMRHPKTMDFAARLQVELPTAIGYLELLWGFTAEHSAQGNVGKWPDGSIAGACCWRGQPDVFIAALTSAGFLDGSLEHRLVVHDWPDHAPGWVRAKLAKLKLGFISAGEATNAHSNEGTSERSGEPSSRARVSSGREGTAREGKGKEPSVEQGSTANGHEPDPVASIFEHWRTVHRHPKAQLDAKRRRLIATALKSYSEADLCQAISGYLNSPHHMGQNSSGTVYTGLDLLQRDAAHIDAGLQFFASPPRSDLSSLTRKNVDAVSDWEPPETRHASA